MEKSYHLAHQNALSTILTGLAAILVTLSAFSAKALGPDPIVCKAQTTSLGHGDIELKIQVHNKADDFNLNKILSADEFEELRAMSFTAKEVAELLADHSKLEQEKPKKEGLLTKLKNKLKLFDLPGGTSLSAERGPFDDGDELVLMMSMEKYSSELTVRVDPIGLTLFPLIYGPRIKNMEYKEELLHFFTGMEFIHDDSENQSFRLLSFAAHCTLEII